MQRYLIVIEPTDSGFSAYSPDVPGCIATARTQPDVERAMQDAIRFHLAGLREDGQPIPQANTSAAYVEVAA